MKEFSDDVLQKVLDEEEFKTVSAKRKRESEMRRNESEPNSPMPKISKEDNIQELMTNIRQNGTESQPDAAIPVKFYELREWTKGYLLIESEEGEAQRKVSLEFDDSANLVVQILEEGTKDLD